MFCNNGYIFTILIYFPLRRFADFDNPDHVQDHKSTHNKGVKNRKTGNCAWNYTHFNAPPTRKLNIFSFVTYPTGYLYFSLRRFTHFDNPDHVQNYKSMHNKWVKTVNFVNVCSTPHILTRPPRAS